MERPENPGNPAAYPHELERDWIGKDGQRVRIRPIRPEDVEIEKNFVRQLSPRSKYLRFFSGVSELTPAMLSRLTRIDYRREMALVAVLEEGGKETEIAVGRIEPYPDGSCCEFALVVDDEWQGRGLGFQILGDLLRIAKELGFRTMKGLILSTNAQMLRLAKDLGFRIRSIPGDSRLVEASRTSITDKSGPRSRPECRSSRSRNRWS